MFCNIHEVSEERIKNKTTKQLQTERYFYYNYINPILDGGGQICPPPAGFFNIAQKPLGLGSWNFVTFSFYI